MVNSQEKLANHRSAAATTGDHREPAAQSTAFVSGPPPPWGRKQTRQTKSAHARKRPAALLARQKRGAAVAGCAFRLEATEEKSSPKRFHYAACEMVSWREKAKLRKTKGDIVMFLTCSRFPRNEKYAVTKTENTPQTDR